MKRFVKSIGYAVNGWLLFFTKEKNGQTQGVVAVLVMVAGFIFHLKGQEWIALLLCIALVIALEMMNSVLEKLIDHLHPHRHEQVKWIKDVAAGAVLVAALISAVIGAIIFLPKIILFLKI